MKKTHLDKAIFKINPFLFIQIFIPAFMHLFNKYFLLKTILNAEDIDEGVLFLFRAWYSA